jgi:glycogen debranching enzyme
MAEILRLEEQFAIVSAAERPATLSRVLKQGDAFAVFDTYGDVVPGPGSEHGFYFAGTRFLSRFELRLGQRQPLLLSSTISDDNVVFTADLTNPDLFKDGRVRLPRGILHLFRTRMLLDGCWLECVRVSNYGLEPLETPLAFQFDADFADVFEVRGTQRAARGRAPCITEPHLPHLPVLEHHRTRNPRHRSGRHPARRATSPVRSKCSRIWVSENSLMPLASVAASGGLGHE